MIKVAQLRAARGLLGWNQTRLAETSGLAISTIKRMEGRSDPLKSSAENVWKVQSALEDAGVIFIDEDDEGPGVRLRKGHLKDLN
jgi:transcriptional regulator with XRE-family HTH domain